MMNVSYFAAVFARTDTGWVGTEAELSEVETAEDVTDLMREAAVETSGDPVVLLVEENDEWFAVLRLDDEDEPVVFLSDARAGSASRLAGILVQYVGVIPEGEDEPCGDPALIEDLGVDAKRLLALCERGAPADALFTLAEEAAFAEEYDRIRV